MRIPRSWLARPVTVVAPEVLGMRLRTQSPEGAVEIMLTEVEAYGGDEDPASHAHHGLTNRNRSMFERAGTLYVYRSYGVHWCANIVTGPAGEGQAVLLRAGRPTVGVDLIRRRRGREDHLCDGPGKLTQAMGLTGEHDGVDLLGGGRIRLLPARASEANASLPVKRSTRVGISEADDKLWRFIAQGL